MKNKVLKNIALVMLSLFTTITLFLNYVITIAPQTDYSGNFIIQFLAFGAILWLFNNSFKIKDKRLSIISAILSVIFSAILVICYQIDHTLSLMWFNYRYIIKFFSYFLLFFAGIKSAFYWLSIKKPKMSFDFSKLSNNKFFFIAWAIIFICYVPFWFISFPGGLFADGRQQLLQITGHYKIWNNYPIISTFIMGIIPFLTNIVHYPNIAMAIYTFVQGVICTAVFAFTLLYMKKRQVNNIIILISFLFYLIYINFSIFSFSVVKDTFFMVAVPLLIISLNELRLLGKEFYKSPKRIILFILSSFFVLFVRHDGVYVYIFIMIFALFSIKKAKLMTLAIAVVMIAMQYSFNNILIPYLGIKGPKLEDTYSVPFQQFARVIKYHEQELTQDEVRRLHAIFPKVTFDEIKTLYEPKLSDNIKGNASRPYIKNHAIGIIKLYAKFALEYPETTFEAFVLNNYGYYYPLAMDNKPSIDQLYNGVEISQKGVKELGLYSAPIIPLQYVPSAYYTFDTKMPIYSLIIRHMAIYFWITLLAFSYAIYTKNYKKKIIPFIALIALWGICLLTPQSGNLRYFIAFTSSLPLLGL